ncbi:phage terminase large subunit [Hymenobacter sp. M29]|uniref:Phage terminase large subunit n=1 Tax=Hymenobacter mellowenesis TaxID=3063995 RepID=A0ABT9AJ76_9BACT|nr:phage terminase large subunit [Hymenobacter sp. M29]MDO7849914.1 phage terminase large subunit [Hymenobacter sp. M29]
MRSLDSFSPEELDALLETDLEEITDDELLADVCFARFYDFFLEFWPTIETVELVPNWHLEYLCDQLQEVFEAWERGESQPDVLINIPPGTSKSTTVTQLFPAWLWLRAPGTRIISSSFASSISVGHGVKSRDCLRSDKFQRLWPGRIRFKGDEDGKMSYRNTRGGQRYVTSSGGAVTGVHADFILVDDPLNPMLSASDASLKQAAKHLETLSTRKTDKGRSVTIMLMQRLHEKDPAGIWLTRGEPLRHICLPGELTPDPKTGELGFNVKPKHLVKKYINGLLDVLRLARPALAKLKLALGSYGYSGQILQQPSPEEGGRIKKRWFRSMSWPAFLENVPGAKTAVWHADGDTAYTEEQKNDPSAVMVSTVLQNTLYVRYSGEFTLEAPELLAKLPQLLKDNGFGMLSKFYIEPKASGKTIVQMLRVQTKLNIVEAPPPMGGKTERVNASTPFIEAGRVVLLDGSWNEALINQCAAFPNAAHDDRLDNLTQAIARATKPQAGLSYA